jgi:hypothetical protein
VPVEGQTIWLKVVPHFFAHEGALLALMAGAQVPVLLGHDGGRVLLAEIAGEDLYAAELPLLLEMVNRLVELQRLRGDHVEQLLALGPPDWGERRRWVPRSPTSSSGRAAKSRKRIAQC